MHVKICGITNTEDALAAARCGADLVGFVLAESPRRVPTATVRDILAALPPMVHPVLVFRDEALGDLLAAQSETGCDWIQLHGREPVAFVRELHGARPQVHVIKAWEVAGPESGVELAAYLDAARAADVGIDVVLLDAPKGAPAPGYQEMAKIAARCTERPPQIWCAGGLTPTNLVTALAGGRYDGVDVSSGVELRPGVKSHSAVMHFVETAKHL